MINIINDDNDIEMRFNLAITRSESKDQLLIPRPIRRGQEKKNHNNNIENENLHLGNNIVNYSSTSEETSYATPEGSDTSVSPSYIQEEAYRPISQKYE